MARAKQQFGGSRKVMLCSDLSYNNLTLNLKIVQRQVGEPS